MSLQFSDKDVTQESVKHWSNASHSEQEAGVGDLHRFLPNNFFISLWLKWMNKYFN